MRNIWFLRMDKYSIDGEDLSYDIPYIHSLHGTCGLHEVAQHKHHIWPKFVISDQKLMEIINEIKTSLSNKNFFDEKDPSKKRCDVAIRYWLSTMKKGDIVFVRNKLNDVYLCEIDSYVLESFFDKYYCFQRRVKNLNQLSKAMVHEDIWKRTMGRKTVEINRSENMKLLVHDFLKKHCSDQIAI